MTIAKRKKHKKTRGCVKWVTMLLLVFLAGGAVTYLRAETDNGSVAATAPFRPQYSANQNPQSSIDLAASLSGITEFQQQYGTSGTGQKIALIDSGIDLSHPAFQNNLDGSRKVAVYYDYTSEGKLKTEAVQYEQNKVSAGGTLYHTGGIYHAADKYYMAFLELGALHPQTMDSIAGQLAVLVTATGDGFDCVYIDTNQNCDFTDEQPLYCYQNGGAHVTVYAAGYPLNIAVTHIAADGSEIQISTDTLGHGTFLAGIMAANGTEYCGLAPQAQLYVYKIFDRDGASSQLMLAQAIEQAVQDSVDCINLSLSIPHDETILPRLRAALQLAQEQNIPVVAAAGNYGPGKNTIAYPARESSVIGVGSYGEPQQYKLDKAIFLEERFIADYSGRGNLSGSASPFLVAPCGVISAVPGWYTEAYMYDYGTSISAAMVTAAVCHLQESVEKGALQGVSVLSVEQMKNLFAFWAQDLQFAVSEQGYGALYMGRLPLQTELPIETIAQREQAPEQVTVYSIGNGLRYANKDKGTNDKDTNNKGESLFLQFSVPQGQSQSWYLMLPKGVKTFNIQLQIDTQHPASPFAHLIALGRCRVSLYNPQGRLVDATEYLGASYGIDVVTSGEVSAWYPQEGLWEIVVTSAENLSQYNHFETTGILQVRTE